MSERALLRDLAPGAWFRTLLTGLFGRMERTNPAGGSIIVKLETDSLWACGMVSQWPEREVHPNLVVEALGWRDE